MLREHWSYQPLTEPRVPGLEAGASGHPADRFIREGLERRGLQPAPPGDRRTLARRLSLVLTGLPPGPAEVDRFVRDPSPDAYERLVDRLFASPHLGERWARHWMDLMRFGETYGYEWNYELLAAWRYRDYLIRAFNQDLPFDQLVREHVAGDLLEQPRIDHRLGLNESIAGAAFFRLGEMGHDNCVTFREIRTDVVDNQIDTLTKAFQGLTVACARCHDHKLDPIPTKDYYALYGILTSSHQLSRTLDTGDSHQRVKAGLKKLKSSIRKELARLWIRQSAQIPDYLLAAQAAQGGSAPASARTAGLDPKRLERWRQVLLKESVDPEGILFPWAAISCEAGFSPGRLPQAWSKLEAYYKGETGARKDFKPHPLPGLRRFSFRQSGWLASRRAWPQGGNGCRRSIDRQHRGISRAFRCPSRRPVQPRPLGTAQRRPALALPTQGQEFPESEAHGRQAGFPTDHRGPLHPG